MLTTAIESAPDMDRWQPPRLEAVSHPSAVSYRTERPTMAGAIEYIKIVRYPTAEEAQVAFGTPDGLFHGLPSHQDHASGGIEASHYYNRCWITWLSGPHIYYVRSSTSALTM